MGWVKEKLEQYVLKGVVGRLVAKAHVYLDGKKTALGAVSLFLWVLIYAVPAIRPDWAYVGALGVSIKEALEGAGIKLDTELLTGGLTLTVTGLVHKLQKYWKGE